MKWQTEGTFYELCDDKGIVLLHIRKPFGSMVTTRLDPAGVVSFYEFSSQDNVVFAVELTNKTVLSLHCPRLAASLLRRKLEHLQGVGRSRPT